MASTAISAQGSLVTVEITAAQTEIKNVRTFDFPGTPAAEIDITNLQSTAKEFLIGLQDFGVGTLEANPDYDDPGQNQLRTLRASGAVAAFEITLPNSKVLGFNARVQNVGINGAVDAAYDGSFELRLTGDVTVT